MKRFYQFLFEADIGQTRLTLLRAAAALAVVLPILFGAYSNFLFEAGSFLNEQPNVLTDLLFADWRRFVVLKVTCLIAALAFILPSSYRFAGPPFLLSFTILDYLSFSVETRAWNFTTHLQLFILLLMFGKSGRAQSSSLASERNSFIVRAMQLTVCELYFQAGLSKLLYGGFEWAWSGDTLFVMTYFHGTAFGKALLPSKEVFALLSTYALVFELSVPFLFYALKARAAFYALLIGFHLGTYLVLRVSFWQLFIFYPLLAVPIQPIKLGRWAE
ncbi:MAG: hypothetical protein EOP06_06455 [Proteobacteria bacterium]|nr:MAG: hypothetical protein EOP06_06455 [Pseudomonadota bacterium]